MGKPSKEAEEIAHRRLQEQSLHIMHFTGIYKQLSWGDNKDAGYLGSSGGGSEPAYNQDKYIPSVRWLIREKHIKTVADLGCGDFRCGPLIYDDLDVTYTGFDAYKDMVTAHSRKFRGHPKYKFRHADIYLDRQELPTADLAILKDVLQHWLVPDIYEFLDYVLKARKFRYILICNCSQQESNDPISIDRNMFLSASFYPLKKYNPAKLFTYQTKEVSLIDAGDSFARR